MEQRRMDVLLIAKYFGFWMRTQMHQEASRLRSALRSALEQAEAVQGELQKTQERVNNGSAESARAQQQALSTELAAEKERTRALRVALQHSWQELGETQEAVRRETKVTNISFILS